MVLQSSFGFGRRGVVSFSVQEPLFRASLNRSGNMKIPILRNLAERTGRVAEKKDATKNRLRAYACDLGRSDSTTVANGS